MKKTLLLALGILLFITANSQTESEKLVYEGIELHDQGKYKKALKKYDQALKIKPGDLLTFAEKAMTLQAMGDYEYCFDVCEEAIKTNPDSEYLDHIFTSYANALDLYGQPEKAIEIYERGILKFPDYYNLHYNKGVTEAGINNFDQSLKSFEAAITCNPFHASSHQAISSLQLENGSKTCSLMAMCRFFVLEPTSERSVQNLVQLENLFKGNVSQSDQTITISIDELSLDDDSKQEKQDNDFSETDLTLGLSALVNLGFDELELSERQKFFNNLNSVIGSLQDTQNERTGFYWDYYAPYFMELKKREHLEVFSYIVYATRTNKDDEEWITLNQEAFKKFYKWDGDYRWPE